MPFVPALSLPKGGGAVQGIGEKFSANPATGTASLSIPLPITPGRGGFTPQLSLTYDSGAGNGVFGLGWTLSLPSITRKTARGVPRYGDGEDSDTFLLSGAEDLVPALANREGAWERESLTRSWEGRRYVVRRYRPRVEGAFARVEQWEDVRGGGTFWRTVTKENVTSVYGRSRDCRIADPADDSRVFSWLLEESADDRGNVIRYEYTREDLRGVDPAAPYERHRLDGSAPCTNLYPKRVVYGNRRRTDDAAFDPERDWLLQVVFDYGEHDASAPRIDDRAASPPWPARADAHSTFRAGFDVRTYRLCRRVLMFHLFEELGAEPCLVRSADFSYEERPDVTYLTAVIQKGYVREAHGGAYVERSMPLVEFTYTRPELDGAVHEADSEDLEQLPAGVDGSLYRWVDLDGEGLAGVLTEQAGAWWYKRNLGGGHFAPAELVARRPAGDGLRGGQQLLDLGGDGRMCLVRFGGQTGGFYQRDEEEGWRPFKPFESAPNVQWDSPNLKFVDLTGDGLPDLLITEDDALVWYESRGVRGFGPAEAVRRRFDEERGPALVFADATQSVYLADMTGDGLTDIVRVRNGEVCYWPNLGYGRFGAKVSMARAPVFDRPEQFSQRRVRLADVDGTGTTDLIYLGRGVVSYWINQAGNGWGEPRRIEQFPETDALATVSVHDLRGDGTACLVWSSPLERDARRPLRYIALTGGRKPHLLASFDNNLGAETRLTYAPSTKFYVADRRAGTPWVTRLPFPVHVVERAEVRDHITGGTFVTRYAYHHGFYDGAEREFRGFGMVEQWDTEERAPFAGGGLFPRPAADELYVPPARTRTWFHTGAFVEGPRISSQFEHEYYEPARTRLRDAELPAGLSAAEAREACRALKGKVLRQEVYADDGSPRATLPYAVTENRYELRRLQPSRGSRPAVFYAYESESLSYHFERGAGEPRVAHRLTLSGDKFGNVKRAASVAYGRRAAERGLARQRKTYVTYTENRYANRVGEEGWYRVGLPLETRTYELVNLPRGAPGLFTPEGLRRAVRGIIRRRAELPYEAGPARGAPYRRLVESERTLYMSDDLTGPLPPRRVESLALVYESYKLAFTPGLFAEVYGAEVEGASAADAAAACGYRDLDADGHWWVPSGRKEPAPHGSVAARRRFAADNFYMPVEFIDPFGRTHLVAYDPYKLLVVRVEDPLRNVAEARNDYRVMSPRQVTDANGNRSRVVFDALGMVAGTAVMGKEGERAGDSLEGFAADLEPEVVAGHFERPLAGAEALLASATTRLVYDLWRYRRTRRDARPQPAAVCTLARETHASDLRPRERTRITQSFVYSDGLGREVQTKVQAEPGRAPARSADGTLVRRDDDDDAAARAEPRWVGTGRTVFNNKGDPVKKYEPYFSDTHEYESERELVEVGVTPVLRYDPLRRLIRTDLPDGTHTKVTFDAWTQTAWDENDTVGESAWLARRRGPGVTAAEARAAALAVGHDGTPAVTHLDALGRTFLTVADNGAGRLYRTRQRLDVEGNLRAVTDARGVTVLRQRFDLLGRVLAARSPDAGRTKTLHDIAGKPVYAWDANGHVARTLYDELRRPVELRVRGPRDAPGAGRVVESTAYGESLAGAERLNLRGKVYRQFDGAGVVTNEEYDFKGNLLRASRQLAADYAATPDWSRDVGLERDVYTTTTTYDALGRAVTSTAPDGSVTRHVFNRAGLLAEVYVRAPGGAAETPFVRRVLYDAKGRRRLIEYGSGAATAYTHDPFTHRLTRLLTTHPSRANPLQSLDYTFDPVGNVVEINDAAQQRNFFANTEVLPRARYEYDALYRLTSAEGREHIGLASRNRPAHRPELKPHYDFNDSTRAGLPHPNDGLALCRYTERYEYDPSGNITSVSHSPTDPRAAAWTRRYDYEPGGNRLRATSLPGDADGAFGAPYAHDAGGNMTAMPHLPGLVWNFKNQLRRVDLGGGGTAFYAYDGAGQRVRKVIERDGAQLNERVYLGGYEIYREATRRGAEREVTLERRTLHVMDDRRRIALVETKTVAEGRRLDPPASRTRYQHDNHLGSSSLELDEHGDIISYDEYYPYGSTAYQAARADVDVGEKRYRYTGKERDDETGFYYHGARYYACWLGRWTSADPAGVGDGTNVYAFVHNRPIHEVDRTGKNGEPWYRFTEAGFYYRAGEHDIHQPHPGVDTGYAPLNAGVNLLVTASNFVGMFGNAVTRTLAAPEIIMRHFGASETDIHAYRFVSMFAGVGEVNAAIRMAANARAEWNAARALIPAGTANVVREAVQGVSAAAPVVRQAEAVAPAAPSFSLSFMNLFYRPSPIPNSVLRPILNFHAREIRAGEEIMDVTRAAARAENPAVRMLGEIPSNASPDRCVRNMMTMARRFAGEENAVVSTAPRPAREVRDLLNQMRATAGSSVRRRSGGLAQARQFALGQGEGTLIWLRAQRISSGGLHALLGRVNASGQFEVWDAVRSASAGGVTQVHRIPANLRNYIILSYRHFSF